jgi:hypothetical protein
MTDRYALTLGEQSEAHTGGRIYGKGLAARGFTVDELCAFRDALGEQARVVHLTDALPAAAPRVPGNEAAVLHIKDGIALLTGSATFADEMLREQQAHPYDTHYWDPRRKRVLHKRARYSIVFGDEAAAPSADCRQSSIIAYRDVPRFQQLRALLPAFFGSMAADLESEGNHYFHSDAGIGFHGDSERRITLCCSLGAPTTLRFYWRAPFSLAPASAPVDLHLAHGDIYLMSQKATGSDWQNQSLYRLVHGAGASKHIQVGLASLVSSRSLPANNNNNNNSNHHNKRAQGTKRKMAHDAAQTTLTFGKVARVQS